MDKINKKRILEMIQKRPVDFIAFVYTPWQAIGASAVLQKLHDEERATQGIICICYHEKSGVLVGDQEFVIPDGVKADLFLYQEEQEGSLFDRFYSVLKGIARIKTRSDKKKLFVLNPLNPKQNVLFYLSAHTADFNLVSVILDEGLASYMWSKRDWVQDAYRINQFSKSAYLKYSIRYYLQFPLVTSLLKRQGLIREEGLLVRINKKLQENEKIIQYYKKVIEANQLEVTTEVNEFYKNSVVIVTQPFFDNHQLVDEDLRILKKVVDVAKRNGKQVVIKPHPRENSLERYEKLECKVDRLSQGVSLEILLNKLKNKPYIMIGFNSTALITGKLIANIPVISIQGLLRRNEIDKSLTSILDAFNNTFSAVVPQPTTEEELERLMDTEISTNERLSK